MVSPPHPKGLTGFSGTVLDRTGLSRSTLYRKIQEGTFPRQIALGARSAGWRESSVSAWMQCPMSYRADA